MSTATEFSGVDLRGSIRFPILQRCLVHPPQASPTQAWQCIAYNISETGVGVTLPLQLRLGAVLSIQAWGLSGARSLQVRVIHTRQVEYLWFTGCQLLKPLSAHELRTWCSGPTNWVDQ